MIRDARDKLLTLVNRATSPTDGDDHEARTAAVQAEPFFDQEAMIRASSSGLLPIAWPSGPDAALR